MAVFEMNSNSYRKNPRLGGVAAGRVGLPLFTDGLNQASIYRWP
jgi:hypothetical protein